MIRSFILTLVFVPLTLGKVIPDVYEPVVEESEFRSSFTEVQASATRLDLPGPEDWKAQEYELMAEPDIGPPIYRQVDNPGDPPPLASNYVDIVAAELHGSTTSDIPSLEDFRSQVTNGNAGQLTGIWVEDILAFRIKSGLTTKAPSSKNTASIYKWAWEHGVVGILVHNYNGGTKLYQLNPGVRIAAIYGNGGIDWYLSRGGTWYESRDSSSGGFSGPFRKWGCSDCDYDVSVYELHDRHYAGNYRLAFQTCVYVAGQEGLMIVEAYLDNPIPALDEQKVEMGTVNHSLGHPLR